MKFSTRTRIAVVLAAVAACTSAEDATVRNFITLAQAAPFTVAIDDEGTSQRAVPVFTDSGAALFNPLFERFRFPDPEMRRWVYDDLPWQFLTYWLVSGADDVAYAKLGDTVVARIPVRRADSSAVESHLISWLRDQRRYTGVLASAMGELRPPLRLSDLQADFTARLARVSRSLKNEGE